MSMDEPRIEAVDPDTYDALVSTVEDTDAFDAYKNALETEYFVLGDPAVHRMVDDEDGFSAYRVGFPLDRGVDDDGFSTLVFILDAAGDVQTHSAHNHQYDGEELAGVNFHYEDGQVNAYPVGDKPVL